MRRTLIIGIQITFFFLGFSLSLMAQEKAAKPERTGKQLFEAACAACHGTDGRGAPASSLGFEIELPDFTDCVFTSREPNDDWSAIIHYGGPMRSFNQMMPSFKDALSDEEINLILGHLRSFCKDDNWPRGELNLPRPLITEKAFPEDEAVLTFETPTEGLRSISQKLIYERRFGARNQLEFALPFTLQERAKGSWIGGVGDIAMSYKRDVFHSINKGSMFSLGGEVSLPSGNKTLGLGGGGTVFEPFVAAAQLLPSAGFIQFQGGFELPADRKATDEAFWRTAIGKSFMQGGYGRSWSPMVELIGARELETGAENEWDIAPQLQISLSKRQHILFNAGFRIPIGESKTRSTQFMMYVIWDWFDGGVFSGWW